MPLSFLLLRRKGSDRVMAKKKLPKTHEEQEDEAVVSPIKSQRKMLVFIGVMGLITLLGGLLLASFNFMKYRYVRSGPLVEPVVYVVPEGAGLSSLAGKLEADGLIDSAMMLKLNAKFTGIGGALKTGEYKVEAGASMKDIIEVFESGKTLLHPVTLPEGMTSAQLMRIIAEAETLSGDLPKTPPEGSLLPETYMHPRGMSRAALVAKMQAAQTELIDKLWENRQPNLPIKTKAEAINLAAVVEKETGGGHEVDKVAGVFINRLNKNMRLQSDPTIIYGISKGEILRGRDGKQRGLRRSEIDRKTEWNTYQIDGLPKTPICNPGAKAIAAVLNPAETDALFFVADGTGGHAFSKTYAEHNRNVAKWRVIERRRRASGGQ